MIGIIGNVSSGKTLTAVKILVEDNKEKRKIIANCTINNLQSEFLSNLDFIRFYLEMIKIKDLEEREEFCRAKFENTYWLIDEIGKVVPSRNRTFTADIFNDFITMVGKLNCEVIYTSQLFESQVDKIYRNLTPVIIDCKRLYMDGTPVLTTKRILVDEIMIQNDYTIKIGKKPIQFSTVFDPKPYYKYYKTKELMFINKYELKKLEKSLR